ncbi:MAG: NAD(P)-binding domain-containing protein, partial [Oscillospiraceae bacterium]|nr:NAD(P)-binding domain-containing protein [Oscillospiraceae bacterium]
MYLLGFIGVGNMGGALARAAAKTVPAEQIVLSNRTPAKAQALAQELGCRAADAATVAESSKFIFLGVKPKDMAACLEEIRPILPDRAGGFVLVSMAAGLDTAAIQT